MANLWLVLAISGVLFMAALWWSLIKRVKDEQGRTRWRRRR